jgi:hypothetical protein
MTTRESYLKRYLESSYREKNKKRLKKRTNLAVYDDDIDWKSFTSSQDKYQSEIEGNDIDEAPVIAEIKDDTIKKWQPVTNVEDERKQKRKRMDSPDLSPKRKKEHSASSPLCTTRSSSSDLSPQREETRSGEGKHRIVSPILQNRQRTRQGRSPYLVNPDKQRVLDDHSPRGQQFEHTSNIDGSNKASQRINCSYGVTVSEVPGNMPLNETKESKTIAQCSESLYHQYADVTVDDYHAKTIYRDKEGHKIDPKLLAREKEKKEKDEEFILWGRG